MRHLDIIIPCYNEQECVCSIFEAIRDVMSEVANWTYSVCYVDDGSCDKTVNEVESLIYEYPNNNVKLISFSRNFGKEAAIFAGLKSSHGDAVVLMDADHQHPPALLYDMLKGLDEGFDTVATHRTDRKGESLVRSWFSDKFYSLMNKFSEVKMEQGAQDYRIMTAQMRDALLSMSERERFSKGLFVWVGFKTKWLDLPNVTRAAGTTKWSFLSLLKYAVSGVVAFSTAPLKISMVLGIITFFAGIAYFMYRLIRYRYLFTTDAIIIDLILIIGGMIIGLLGIIGEYLTRIYSEVKRRPIYIIKTKKGFSEDENKTL